MADRGQAHGGVFACIRQTGAEESRPSQPRRLPRGLAKSTAVAISGALKGTKLDIYPYVRTTWSEWKKHHPDTLMLKPLPGYIDRLPAINTLVQAWRSGEGVAPEGSFSRDERLRPREIVAGLEIGDASTAYPFSVLRRVHVVNETVGGIPILVIPQPSSDTTTAFDARHRDGSLHFRSVDEEAETLVDLETRSRWNAYGRSTAGGRLRGTQLKPLSLVGEFWFAWSEFHPKTKVYRSGDTN